MIMTAAAVAAQALTDADRPVGARLTTLMESHGSVLAARGPASALDFATFRKMLRGELHLLLPDGVPAEELLEVRLISDEGLFEEDTFDLELEQRMLLAAIRKIERSGWAVSADAVQGELDQTAVVRALRKHGVQKEYTEGRQALVDVPAGSRTQIRDLPLPPSVTDFYREIPFGAVYEAWWFPCPVCKWPMRITRHKRRSGRGSKEFGVARCFHRPHVEDGANYQFKIPAEGKPPKLVPFPLAEPVTARESVLQPKVIGFVPEPLPTAGYLALARSVWRWTTVPGLVEVALFKVLSARGLDPVLWPVLDSFDLLVEVPDGSGGTLRFAADVKDHTSALLLGQKIRAEGGDGGGAEWIVVPDRREGQLPLLRGVCEEFGLKVSTASQFGEMVCQATGVSWL